MTICVKLENTQKNDPLWKETVQKILVDEYEKIIVSSIESLKELFYEGYTKENAIALLFDKRLPEWPKTVKRLLEQRDKPMRRLFPSTDTGTIPIVKN